MLAFSTCWLSHRHTDGRVLCQEITLQGFDTIEISHGTSVSLFPGILQAMEREKVSICGVHNFCPSPVELQIDAPDAYEFTSHRPDERRRAIKLTLQSIDSAVRFGGGYVVLHLGGTAIKGRTRRLEQFVLNGGLNSRDFVKEKLKFVRAREAASKLAIKRVHEALAEIIPYAEERKVKLGIESRSHYEQVPDERELLQLLDQYDSPSVAYWHDFGHVQRKANLGLLDHAEWLAAVRDRLCGSHLHDVVWPEQDHHVPFAGSIDYGRLIPLLPKDAPIVWEISPRRKSKHIKEAVVRWREKYGD